MDFAEWSKSVLVKFEYHRTFEHPGFETMTGKGFCPVGLPDLWIVPTTTHWICRLEHEGRAMSTPYSMGPAHYDKKTGNPIPPTLAGLLECLASDSSGVDQPFESWAGDLGYDPDSHKAERIYQACQKTAADLKRVLGVEAYNSLLQIEW